MEPNRQQILKEETLELLKPLFIEARRLNLWFYSRYDERWFSPAQLAEAHRNGLFIRHPDQWELRDPERKYVFLIQEVERARRALGYFRETLERGKKAEEENE